MSDIREATGELFGVAFAEFSRPNAEEARYNDLRNEVVRAAAELTGEVVDLSHIEEAVSGFYAGITTGNEQASGYTALVQQPPSTESLNYKPHWIAGIETHRRLRRERPTGGLLLVGRKGEILHSQVSRFSGGAIAPEAGERHFVVNPVDRRRAAFSLGPRGPIETEEEIYNSSRVLISKGNKKFPQSIDLTPGIVAGSDLPKHMARLAVVAGEVDRLEAFISDINSK